VFAKAYPGTQITFDVIFPC